MKVEDLELKSKEDTLLPVYKFKKNTNTAHYCPYVLGSFYQTAEQGFGGVLSGYEENPQALGVFGSDKILLDEYFSISLGDGLGPSITIFINGKGNLYAQYSQGEKVTPYSFKEGEFSFSLTKGGNQQGNYWSILFCFSSDFLQQFQWSELTFFPSKQFFYEGNTWKISLV